MAPSLPDTHHLCLVRLSATQFFPVLPFPQVFSGTEPARGNAYDLVRTNPA